MRLEWRSRGLLSMRTRLVAFALLCAVPVLTLTVLQMRSDSEHLVAHAVDNARTTAERLDVRLVQLLRGAEGVAYAIGAMDLASGSSAKACSQALARALRSAGPYVLNYTVATRQGDVVCSGRLTSEGVNISDRPHFRQALASRRPVLSGHAVARLSKRDALLLAVPVLDDDGEVAEIASIALAADALTQDLVQGSSLPTTLALLDRDGVLVSTTATDAAVRPGKSYADTPLFRHALTLMAEPRLMAGLDGSERHYVTRPVVYRDELVMWVAAGVELRPLQAAAQAARWRQLGVVLLVAAAVVVVAVTATRPLVLARLGKLLQAAREVSQGDYRHRVPIEVRDELTPAEEAFNHMLEAVEADRAVLADSENRWRMLFEHSLDGVLQTTPDGRILAANPAACRLLGRTEQELTSLTRSDLADLTDPRLPGLLRQREETGQARGELRFVRGDGSTLEMAIASSVYVDSSGRRCTCLVIHDVSERQAAQEQILRLNRELEWRVDRRTRELQAANRELEAFSYSVSHDLRAPASVVVSFAGVLEENEAVQGDKNRHYLRRIRAAGEHMNELIDGLLALSHVSRSQLDWGLVDLSQLAREAIQELRDAEPQRTVSVHVEPDLHAMGDGRLLRVVLSNLIANAWKFTRHRPLARIVVEAQADPESAQPVFCVRDNGDGFDPAQAHRLFLAFHRLHGPSEFPGVGIGLATVQRIVQRHGGRIWADARPGEGASFFFVLGAQESPAAQPVPAEAAV
jgi:PAS domain S-box-containing protein